MQRFHVLWMIALTALLAFGLFTSCDLLEGEENANVPPQVEFVNVPLDSTIFNYAPEVHWTGHDPDGFVEGYEYFDDASDEGVAAFLAGDAQFQTYVNNLDPGVWVRTQSTSETVFLLTEEGDTTAHIFMVRCFDDKGSYSGIAVKTFFRENNAPYAPLIRWAQDAIRCDTSEAGFDIEYVVCDTLFWGDTVTATYPGIQFLWQGRDPDSRLTNIIPLEYRYLLIYTATGDTMEVPVPGDSLVSIRRQYGWSDWLSATQVTLFGSDYETGEYSLFLQVRDDGLTLSDTTARADFYAIKPERDKEMLVVLANGAPRAVDFLLGGMTVETVNDFYRNELLPDAYRVAEELRNMPQVVSPEEAERIGAFDDFVNDVEFFENPNHYPIPYDYIHHFKIVWWVCDNNMPVQGLSDMREEVLEDYMDVGGNVMLSGRTVLSGPFSLDPGTRVPSNFFQDYFGLQTVFPKSRVNNPELAETSGDFGGASTGTTGFPPLSVDTSKTHLIRWGLPTSGFTPDCLPEIEWFGRSLSQTGLDFGVTILNYVSCTLDDPFEAFNQDLDVDTNLTTASVAVLSTPDNHNRIMDVLRVYNVTRGVFGDFMYVDPNPTTGGIPRPRIYVSTPASAGTWLTEDTLEVDYVFIPITIDHDQPIGQRFARMSGEIEIQIDEGGTQIRIVAQNRFKTSLYTVPFFFIDNTPQDPPAWAPGLGEVGPLSLLVAAEFLWFNQRVDYEFNQ